MPAQLRFQAGDGGDRHLVRLPARSAFLSEEAWIATAWHEAVHWTGSASRLNRNLSGRFGDPQYAAEELIAEMGAAFLCSDLGVHHVSQAASYLQGWLRLLQGDCRAVLVAAREAQRAADFLLREPSEPDVTAEDLGATSSTPRESLAVLD